MNKDTFTPFVFEAWVKKINWSTGSIISDNTIRDGDSFWLLIDRGTREYTNSNCRLHGVNAYELNDENAEIRAKAIAGKEWLKNQIEGKFVFVLSKGLDKYGRLLVIVWKNKNDFGDNSKSINTQLITAGHAIAYKV